MTKSLFPEKGSLISATPSAAARDLVSGDKEIDCDDFHIYTDGGNIGPNPSAKGGTWAFCYVSGNRILHGQSGIVRPEEIGQGEVSNNTMETIAILFALESIPRFVRDYLPSVHVNSDSQVSINRFENYVKVKFEGMPGDLASRVRVVASQLRLKFRLLGGHPTRADLHDGFRHKDGKPVSRWNVWCDEECTRRAGEYGSVQPSDHSYRWSDEYCRSVPIV